MSARALCLHVALLRQLSPASLHREFLLRQLSPASLHREFLLRQLSPASLHREFLAAQRLHNTHGRPKTDPDEETRRVLLRPQGTAFNKGYTLHYNPFQPVAPSFRQRGNHYSVISSRHVSSGANSPPERNSGDSEVENAKRQAQSRHDRRVQIDRRAFQRCRSEYSAMTLDRSKPPLPVLSKEDAFLILDKVTMLKGKMEPSDVTEFLCKLTHLDESQIPSVKDERGFTPLLNCAVENMHRFTHAQQLEVLRSIVWLRPHGKNGMMELFETEFDRRAGEMSLHELLLAADLWRVLRWPAPRYLEQLYDRVSLHSDQMGVAELVQLLYIMGESRRCPGKLVHLIEKLLMQHLGCLEPEEMGAVCLGLFKTQVSLSRGTVDRLVDKAHLLAKDMSDFSLVNVLKVMRFNYLYHQQWMQAMVQEVPRRAPTMLVEALMHVALACSSLHYRDDRILLAVAESVPSVARFCRTKDLAKLLWAFGVLDLLPSLVPKLYPSLIELVRERVAEFQHYPEHFLTALLGLAFVRMLPEDLLAVALSPDFVSLATCSKLDLRKDLFTLDGIAALEFPHWTGPRLSGELKDEMTKHLWDLAQSDVCQKPEVVFAEKTLQKMLGGKQFVRKCMILPWVRSIDLEVHLNVPSSSQCEEINPSIMLTEDLLAQLTNTKKMQTPHYITSTPIRPSLRRTQPDEEGGLLRAVDLPDGPVGTLGKTSQRLIPLAKEQSPKATATTKLAIQVSDKSHYLIGSQQQRRQLRGLYAMKRRYLQLAGYKVVELPHWEWFPILRRSLPEKVAYLHRKVFSSLD